MYSFNSYVNTVELVPAAGARNSCSKPSLTSADSWKAAPNSRAYKRKSAKPWHDPTPPFAAASLLLAAIGVYGLIVFAVQQRRLEIGIRLALGATPYQVRNMVVSEGVRLALVGVFAGVAASLVLARYMKTLLYGVQPIDPTVMAISGLTLGAVAAAASYLPAYRASLLDPAKALRSA